jgi:restriction alleviation protein Lar
LGKDLSMSEDKILAWNYRDVPAQLRGEDVAAMSEQASMAGGEGRNERLQWLATRADDLAHYEYSAARTAMGDELESLANDIRALATSRAEEPAPAFECRDVTPKERNYLRKFYQRQYQPAASAEHGPAKPDPEELKLELLAIDQLIPRKEGDLRSVYARVLEAVGAKGPQSVVMGQRSAEHAPAPQPDDETLKPCPFCGGSAEMKEIEEGDNAGASFIECSVCRASTNLQFSLKDDGTPWLRERWNSRAAAQPDATTAPLRSAVLEEAAKLVEHHAKFMLAPMEAGKIRSRFMDTAADIRALAAQPAPARLDEPKVLTAADIERIGKLSGVVHRCDYPGSHSYHLCDCDCLCGRTYTKDWGDGPVAYGAYGKASRPRCKCKPEFCESAR